MMRFPSRLLVVAVLSLATAPVQIQAQDWAARFRRSPLCDARWDRATAPSYSGVYGALVVRPVLDSGRTPQAYTQIELTPLHPDGADTSGRRRVLSTPSGFRFDSLPAGSYTLKLRFVGESRELDTIQTRATYADTVTLSLLDFFTAWTNRTNCRPHRFRRDGENACVTGPDAVEQWIPYAMSFADPGRNRDFHLQPFRAEDAKLVHDEATCVRAGLAYDSTSPPRRVIVVDIGRQYLVFDPFEPLSAGEWQLACLYGRKWEPIECVLD